MLPIFRPPQLELLQFNIFHYTEQFLYTASQDLHDYCGVLYFFPLLISIPGLFTIHVLFHISSLVVFSYMFYARYFHPQHPYFNTRLRENSKLIYKPTAANSIQTFVVPAKKTSSEPSLLSSISLHNIALHDNKSDSFTDLLIVPSHSASINGLHVSLLDLYLWAKYPTRLTSFVGFFHSDFHSGCLLTVHLRLSSMIVQ